MAMMEENVALLNIGEDYCIPGKRSQMHKFLNHTYSVINSGIHATATNLWLWHWTVSYNGYYHGSSITLNLQQEFTFKVLATKTCIPYRSSIVLLPKPLALGPRPLAPTPPALTLSPDFLACLHATTLCSTEIKV